MTFSSIGIAVILIVVGATLCVWFGGYFVGWAVDQRLNRELADPGGMEKAGRAIGWAERTLIYVFVLADATTAIGLLIAAKSIMRIGEFKGGSDDDENGDDGPADRRAMTEYVIFGTLASFAWAVSIAYIFRWILME